MGGSGRRVGRRAGDRRARAATAHRRGRPTVARWRSPRIASRPKVGAESTCSASDGSIRPLGKVNGSVEDLRWSPPTGRRSWRWRRTSGRTRPAVNSATTIGGVARTTPWWCARQSAGGGCGRSMSQPARPPVPLRGLNVWEFDWHGGRRRCARVGGPVRERLVRRSGGADRDGEVTTVYTPRAPGGLDPAAPGSGAIALVEALASDRGVLYGQEVTVIDAGGTPPSSRPGSTPAEVSWIDDDRLLCAGMATSRMRWRCSAWTAP